MKWAPVITLMGFAACGTVAPKGPAAVVEAQAGAVRRGDLIEASALLAPSARANAPAWPSPDTLPARGSAREVSRTARWSDEGVGLTLVRESGGWRIADGVLGLLSAHTPEQALATFARALLARDFEGLFALLPRADRREWTPALLASELGEGALWGRWVALAEALSGGAGALSWIDRDHLDVVVGESRLRLLREGEAWKVFDVRPERLYTSRRAR